MSRVPNPLKHPRTLARLRRETPLHPIERLGLNFTSGFPLPTLEAMEVQLTPDRSAFVKDAIESGRLAREEDVAREALSLLEELSNETLPQLAGELKREARMQRECAPSCAQYPARHIAENNERADRFIDLLTRNCRMPGDMPYAGRHRNRPGYRSLPVDEYHGCGVTRSIDRRHRQSPSERKTTGGHR